MEQAWVILEVPKVFVGPSFLRESPRHHRGLCLNQLKIFHISLLLPGSLEWCCVSLFPLPEPSIRDPSSEPVPSPELPEPEISLRPHQPGFFPFPPEEEFEAFNFR